MRRTFFFIVAVCLATSSFALIPRASALDVSSPRFDPLPETRIRVSEDLAPFERRAPSLLSRALRQAYEQASTTNASGLAGFLSVDPTWESADLGRPQSWNRYSYVMNNPVNAVDPDGRMTFLLPPTMPFHLGLNHPKSETVQQMEKAVVAVGAILVAVIATKGDAIFAPSAGESGPTARQVADAEQASGRRGGTAGTLRTADGNTYSDTSGANKQLHPDVQGALDSVPANQRSAFHGNCAEPGCVSKAIEGGSNPAGGVIDTAKIRGPNSPNHGQPHNPCSTCQRILDFFGIKYEPK